MTSYLPAIILLTAVNSLYCLHNVRFTSCAS